MNNAHLNRFAGLVELAAQTDSELPANERGQNEYTVFTAREDGANLSDAIAHLEALEIFDITNVVPATDWDGEAQRLLQGYAITFTFRYI